MPPLLLVSNSKHDVILDELLQKLHFALSLTHTKDNTCLCLLCLATATVHIVYIYPHWPSNHAAVICRLELLYFHKSATAKDFYNHQFNQTYCSGCHCGSKQGIPCSLRWTIKRPFWLLMMNPCYLQKCYNILESLPALILDAINLFTHLTIPISSPGCRQQSRKSIFGGEKKRHSKDRTCDATTTHPACPSDLYFEEQIGTRCQLHAFNALVGSQLLCHDAVIKHLEKFSSSQPYLKECYGAAGFDEAINHFLQHQITPAMFIGCPQSYRISLGSCKEDILKLLPPDCDRFLLRFDKASYCHATCIKYSHEKCESLQIFWDVQNWF